MKLHEHKIIILLAKLTDDELVRFLETTALDFVANNESLLLKELDTRRAEADASRDNERSATISACYHRLTQAKYRITMKDLNIILADIE